MKQLTPTMPSQLTVNFNIMLSNTPRNQSEFILSGLINIIFMFFHLPPRGLIYPTPLNLLDLIIHIIVCETCKLKSYCIWCLAQFCYSIFLSGQNVTSTSLIYTPCTLKYKECRVLVSYSWLNRLCGAESETDGEQSVEIFSQHSPGRNKKNREMFKYVWPVTCWVFEAMATEIFRRCVKVVLFFTSRWQNRKQTVHVVKSYFK